MGVAAQIFLNDKWLFYWSKDKFWIRQCAGDALTFKTLKLRWNQLGLYKFFSIQKGTVKSSWFCVSIRNSSWEKEFYRKAISLTFAIEICQQKNNLK